MPTGHLRGGVRIAAVEFRRSLRTATNRVSQLLGLGFGLLVFGGMATVGAYFLVTLSPDLSGLAVGDGIRSAVAFQWLFASALFTQRVATVHARPDADAFLLTTVRPTTALVGLMLAELARAVAYLGVPVLVLAAALAYTAGSPATFLLVSGAVLASLAAAVVTGHVLGLTAKLLVARVPAIARRRSLLGGLAAAAFFGGYIVLQSAGMTTSGLGVVPVGWLADVAVLASPVGSSLPHAVAGLAVVVAWLVAGSALCARLATAFWLGDSVAPAVEAEQAVVGSDGADPLAAALGRIRVPSVWGEPSRRVAQRSILLARRAPAKLTYLILPLAGLFPTAIQVALGEASVPTRLLAPGLAVAVPWFAAGAFALNPLGDEGRVLPQTLTSLADGRAYVRGLALPPLLFGLPAALLAPAVALATGYGPTDAVLVAAAALVGVVVAAFVGPTLGFLVPRTDAVRVARGREVVPPTLTAMALHTLVVVLFVALPAFAALAPDLARATAGFVVGGLFAFPFDLAGVIPIADALRSAARAVVGVPLPAVRWGGFAGPLVAGLAVAALAARVARRRFEGYTL
ncbi:hypothetical protein [Halosegnis marinus]|uniref:ABC-2 type transport system permease protein n=1 Tax=Halosegnis marinus TaxID=3034023 RepID=A0ABD5ZPU3_9EURY|nr:hypothetical protein [Halosegnis sp. DT85]